MPYKIHKLRDDRRNNLCGYMIPNGGFYHVVEMTFENHLQLTHIGQRAGYTVDYVDGPVGFFDPDGYEVEPGSVVLHEITKAVMDYKRVTYKYRGKETPKRQKHIGTEREETERLAQRHGLRATECSTQQIKKALSLVNQREQKTLAIAS